VWREREKNRSRFIYRRARFFISAAAMTLSLNLYKRADRQTPNNKYVYTEIFCTADGKTPSREIRSALPVAMRMRFGLDSGFTH